MRQKAGELRQQMQNVDEYTIFAMAKGNVLATADRVHVVSNRCLTGMRFIQIKARKEKDQPAKAFGCEEILFHLLTRLWPSSNVV